MKMRVCSLLENLPSFFSHRIILSSILAIFHIIHHNECGFYLVRCAALPLLPSLLSYFCGHIFFCSHPHTKRRHVYVYHGPSQKLFRKQKTLNWQLSWPKPARKTSRCQATRQKMQATKGSNNWPTDPRNLQALQNCTSGGSRGGRRSFAFLEKRRFHLTGTFFRFTRSPAFLYAIVLLSCGVLHYKCTVQPSRPERSPPS